MRLIYIPKYKGKKKDLEEKLKRMEETYNILSKTMAQN